MGRAAGGYIRAYIFSEGADVDWRAEVRNPIVHKAAPCFCAACIPDTCSVRRCPVCDRIGLAAAVDDVERVASALVCQWVDPVESIDDDAV